MMKRIWKKLLLSIIIFVATLVHSQRTPPPEPVPNTTGQGTLSQPIDMYVIWLAVLAVGFIIYFARKKTQKIV